METKDVTIDRHRFQLGRMTPLVGSRILNVLISSSVKTISEASQSEDKTGQASFNALSSEEKARDTVATLWMLAAANTSEEIYSQLQKYSLQACAIYVGESDAPPIPVLAKNGRWADRTLEEDVKTVNKLILESLQFNLSAFFLESALSVVEATKAQVTNQSTIPPATDYYSAP